MIIVGGVGITGKFCQYVVFGEVVVATKFVHVLHEVDVIAEREEWLHWKRQVAKATTKMLEKGHPVLGFMTLLP